MSEKNSQMVYDVVALSESVLKWVSEKFGAESYEKIYKPMWLEVIKNSHFTSRRKIESSKLVEIVKTFLPNDAEYLLSYIETRKIYVAF